MHKMCIGRGACQKKFLTRSQAGNALLVSRLKRLSPCCAHNLCAIGAQIPHLQDVKCFVRGRSVQKKCLRHFLAQAEAAVPRGGTTRRASPCAAKLYEVFDSLTNGAAIMAAPFGSGSGCTCAERSAERERRKRVTSSLTAFPIKKNEGKNEKVHIASCSIIVSGGY